MKTEINEILVEIDELGEQLATALFKLSSLKERLKKITSDNSETSENSEHSENSEITENPEKGAVRDLRSAFSINDRFRFRRELFGGSDAEMNKALAHLSELTPEQAEAFTLTLPGFNPLSPEAEAFMAIVRRALSDHPSHVI